MKINFEIVGHTHEDIDQLFKAFFHLIGENPVMDHVAMMALFEKLLEKSPRLSKKTKLITAVPNWSNWMQDGFSELRNHSKPHTFKFELNLN